VFLDRYCLLEGARTSLCFCILQKAWRINQFQAGKAGKAGKIKIDKQQVDE
jgi:hypothetical protein